MSRAYYNEHDPFAAAWLRNLIEAGQIAPGDVDERSIADVRPSDLDGYTQCHFFAGLGGWSLALRLAGWRDDVPVWTGSCPCQPFSAAGKGRGVADERHLWPEFYRLIGEHRPPVVFGEQVASAAGRSWLAAVRADLEGLGYGVGAADLCAAGVGAPHIRQRIWWGGAYRVAHPHGRNPSAVGLQRGREHRQWPEDRGALRSLDQGLRGDLHGGLDPGAPNHTWGDADWIFCRDGRWRPVEPGTFPLANGVSGRMGKLRAYGNAIVPQVAAVFIETFREASQGIAPCP